MPSVVAFLLITSAVTIIIIAAPGTKGSPNPRPTSTSSTTGGPVVSGTITFPSNGASNIPKGNLQATGTARNIKKGHHLELFLSVTGNNRYYPSYPSSITLIGTRWKGITYIAPTLPAGEHVSLWLVDLGPNSFTILNTNAADQNLGFTSLKLGSDTTILYGVTFTVK